MSSPLIWPRLHLAGAGVALAAYPVLRPYGPDTGRAAAAAFASTAWLVAHVLAMTGFVLLALAIRGAAGVSSPRSWSTRGARRLEGIAWSAVALMLPYYGAEAYGVHEVGRYAVVTGDPRALAVVEHFRYAPFEIVTFAAGLIALGAVGFGLARGLRGTGPLGRTGGLLAGAALVSYLPQYAAGPQVRILHGVVLGVGLVLVAAARRPSPPCARPAPEAGPSVGSARAAGSSPAPARACRADRSTAVSANSRAAR